jgi:hypothetical protein
VPLEASLEFDVEKKFDFEKKFDSKKIEFEKKLTSKRKTPKAFANCSPGLPQPRVSS